MKKILFVVMMLLFAREGHSATLALTRVVNGTTIDPSVENANQALVEGFVNSFDGANLSSSSVVSVTSVTTSGALTINGNTTLGNASTDTITTTAQFSGDLIPSAAGTYDLGSSSLDWQDVFCNTLDVDGAVTLNSTVDISGDLTDIGGGTYARANGDNDLGVDGDVEVNGALQVDGTTDLNGAVDIDSSAINIDGGLTDIGTGSYAVANGDNDLGIAGDLEVDGLAQFDGAVTFASTTTFSGMSKVYAYRNTSVQSIDASTPTKIQFNAENFDTGSEFDSSTNYRFTATNAGYYYVDAGANFQSPEDAKQYQISIYVGGSEYKRSAWHASSTTDILVRVSGLVKVTTPASDYIEIYVTHNSAGGAKNIENGSALTNVSITEVP